MTNTQNCPVCKVKAHSDISHQKICINDKCEIEGRTYLYHEWIKKHEKLNKPLTVENQMNDLMEGFA